MAAAQLGAAIETLVPVRLAVPFQLLEIDAFAGRSNSIFVIETLSVMLQVGWFKYTKKKYGTGRRILKMAPLHHHFEKSGWKETQVVVRFWIITILLVLFGLSTLKIR